MPEDKKLFTLEEAGEKAGLSVEEIAHYIKKELITPAKIGKKGPLLTCYSIDRLIRISKLLSNPLSLEEIQKKLDGT